MPTAGPEAYQVQEVLRQDQRVEAVALVNGVLVVGLQLVERNDLQDVFVITFGILSARNLTFYKIIQEDLSPRKWVGCH